MSISKIFIKFLRYKQKNKSGEINPEEIFMDSSNLPDFDKDQFEGRLERPITKKTLYGIGVVFLLLITLYVSKVWTLQIESGSKYRVISENNRLNHYPIFAGRGIIFDRKGEPLVYNSPQSDSEIPKRVYKEERGLAHVLGYVQYPSKDKYGFFYKEDFDGIEGAEKLFNEELSGQNGLRLIEVNARGEIQSENRVRQPIQGENIHLSIDYKIQNAMFDSIRKIATESRFTGGAGIIMDVGTGEVIALTSYPEYDPNVMSDRSDIEKVRSFLNDNRKPFLDRAIDGLYTPGSIMKPFVALAVLDKEIIHPTTNIVSTGSISIPNQYDPSKFTVFRDWKAHGAVDMKKAIAVSSDVYFYAVSGGYKDQKGVGISILDEYFKKFGFGEAVGGRFFGNAKGVIPTPEWKLETFGEPWYLGNTYHTAIGQYGFQVTPLQAVRAISALANEGYMVEPTLLKDDRGKKIKVIDSPLKNIKIVNEGMRMAVTDGTVKGLDLSFVKVAGKSGTAELGVKKEYVNSWVIGYFPYDKPKYAFAIIMERGPVSNLIGSGAVMRGLLEWMNTNTPEYFTKSEI